MADQINSTRALRSEVKPDGRIHLSVQSIGLPAPGPDEIVVEVEAAPLHPADIGLLLGPADLSDAVVSGEGENKSVSLRIPPERMAALATRTGIPLGVGNEAAGIVISAGERHRDLVGKAVAVMGGAMVTRYRVVSERNFLPLPDGVPVQDGAAVLTNPLTALAMLETMRGEGHTALVHTAAASSLGQMLNRICLADEIGLVNVVRSPAQVDLLKSQGALHVCDSSAPSFTDDLNDQVAATGATLAFDAVGGGKLAGQILTAMERHCLSQMSGYHRYGSKTRKQVYYYGGLDTRPSELDRSYGMAWSVGGWLIFDELERIQSERIQAMRRRISAEMQSTFASSFAGELSIDELMDPENLKIIASRKTGLKFIINPKKP